MSKSSGSLWRKLQHAYAIGSYHRLAVADIKPYGLFLDLEAGISSGFECMGIVDLASPGLPTDHDSWPREGDILEVKVAGYRQHSMQIDFVLVTTCIR